MSALHPERDLDRIALSTQSTSSTNARLAFTIRGVQRECCVDPLRTQHIPDAFLSASGGDSRRISTPSTARTKLKSARDYRLSVRSRDRRPCATEASRGRRRRRGARGRRWSRGGGRGGRGGSPGPGRRRAHAGSTAPRPSRWPPHTRRRCRSWASAMMRSGQGLAHRIGVDRAHDRGVELDHVGQQAGQFAQHGVVDGDAHAHVTEGGHRRLEGGPLGTAPSAATSMIRRHASRPTVRAAAAGVGRPPRWPTG